MKINWNFLGGGRCKTKNLPWGEYGYFLELHNVLVGRNVRDNSNFYLVIMSLILITFSLDLCIDTVRRNLMLVTLGAKRVN